VDQEAAGAVAETLKKRAVPYPACESCHGVGGYYEDGPGASVACGCWRWLTAEEEVAWRIELRLCGKL
jgi:mono/diheme cytochrome c family protein